MPQILEDLVAKLKARGMPKSNAFAVATSALQKQGKIKRGSQELTQKGQGYASGTSRVPPLKSEKGAVTGETRLKKSKKLDRMPMGG